MESHIVIGLAFGDEGKGSWVDHLVRKDGIRTVVRFNGGAQALHHVVDDRGHLHGFSQFGSGTFVPSTRTLLSRFMLVEPLSAMSELQSLLEIGAMAFLDLLYISEDAPIIPYSNMLLNRIMELSRGDGRHGSCGLGIGLTQEDVEVLGPDALYVRDLIKPRSLREKLKATFDRAKQRGAEWESEFSAPLIQELNSIDIEEYAQMLETFGKEVNIISDDLVLKIISRESCVFEGAQGVLLDQHYGLFPHCTRSTTTTRNAMTLMSEAGFEGEITTHGLLRAYGTRHGAGPFPTEDHIPGLSPCDNMEGVWQGSFRTGWFDSVLAKYALSVSGGVDKLVITNVDRLSGQSSIKLATSYAGMDGKWFDQGSATLSVTGSYEENRKRTEAISKARPIYREFRGWSNIADFVPQEKFFEAIESILGQPIAALSCTKGNSKTYRVHVSTPES